MSEKPEQAGRGWAKSVGVLLMLVGVYVCGYFALGSYHSHLSWNSFHMKVPHHSREFPGAWLYKAYYPLGWLEFMLRGRDEPIYLYSEDDFIVFRDEDEAFN